MTPQRPARSIPGLSASAPVPARWRGSSSAKRAWASRNGVSKYVWPRRSAGLLRETPWRASRTVSDTAAPAPSPPCFTARWAPHLGSISAAASRPKMHAIMSAPDALPTTAALLVIDLQKAIDAPYWGPRNNPDCERNVAALLERWRATRRPIYHIKHDSTEPQSAYRPGQPGND